MSESYGLTCSSGHDPSLNMQILTSIIQKGFRQAYSFRLSLDSDGEELNSEIPFSTFGVLEKVFTHADKRNYSKGTIIGPFQHILSCLAEDLGAALDYKVIMKCKNLFELSIRGLAKKPSASNFLKKKKNVLALVI